MAPMGICHGYLRVPRLRLEALFSYLDRIVEGEPTTILADLMDYELLEDEVGAVRLETTTRGLFRKRQVMQLEPRAELIVDHFLGQIENDDDVGAAFVDKLFSRWNFLDVHTKGIADVDLMEKAMWGTTQEPIPKRYRGESYAIIDHESVGAVATAARAVAAANADRHDEYVLGGLASFAALLESATDDDYVVAYWS